MANVELKALPCAFDRDIHVCLCVYLYVCCFLLRTQLGEV